MKDVDRHIRGQEAPVAELWKSDKLHLLPLPKQDYPACVTRPVKANPYSQVVFETNRYSVPHTYAGKQLVLRAYPFKIEVLSLKPSLPPIRGVLAGSKIFLTPCTISPCWNNDRAPLNMPSRSANGAKNGLPVTNAYCAVYRKTNRKDRASASLLPSSNCTNRMPPG